jgi:hypothetical protein
MYVIQLRWINDWVTMPGTYRTRDDAEWATAKWKQSIDLSNDQPFRVKEIPSKDDGTRPPVREGGCEHCGTGPTCVVCGRGYVRDFQRANPEPAPTN